MTEQPVVRFRRPYRGGNSEGRTESRWHIAVQPYRKGELYRRYLALCGYEIENPWMRGGDLSYAKKPKGTLCAKCEKKQKEGDHA